jgi:hypothetical protein
MSELKLKQEKDIYRDGKGREELGCIDEDLIGIKQKSIGSKPKE